MSSSRSLNKLQAFNGDPRRQPRIGGGAGASSPSLPALAPLGWESAAPASEAPSGRLDVAGLWRGLLRHAGLVAFGFAVSLAGGAAVTLLTRPTFTAATTIQIDRESEQVVTTNEQ